MQLCALSVCVCGVGVCAVGVSVCVCEGVLFLLACFFTLELTCKNLSRKFFGDKLRSFY